LSVVLPAALLARAASTAMIWLFVLHTERPVNLRGFDRRKVRELLGYGAWITLSSSIAPLLQTFDQLLIGALLGPASIAHYSVPMNLATRSQVISVSLTKTLFPRMSQATVETARLLAARAAVTLSFGFGAVCGPAMLLAGPFLQAWVGPDFASYATPVAQILLIGAWTNGLAYLPYGMLQSQGRPDLTAKIHSIEVIPFLLILFVLVRAFGLPGAAAAWTLRTSVDCVVMMRVGGCWIPMLKRVLPSLGLLMACFVMTQLTDPVAVTRLPLAALSGLLFIAGALVFDPQAGTIARAAMLAVGNLRERRKVRRTV
jgi:O-antigen/teichoic acid export membrane protein